MTGIWQHPGIYTLQNEHCSLSHNVSCSAAPWYVYNTLMKSERRVDNAESADVIFVYDYCRLMWALSEEHAAHHW